VGARGGEDVMVPTQHVLPNGPRNGIVLNLAEKRMYYYRTPTEIETFSAGTGRDGWETPVGSYTIIEKIKDPTWTPPESIRREHAAKGDILPAVVPAGPDNPLGMFALRLSNPSYLLHGTNKPWGVGHAGQPWLHAHVSGGYRALFGQVETGTPVTIVDQPYKVGWLGDQALLGGERAQRREQAEVGEGDHSGVDRECRRGDRGLGRGETGTGGKCRPATGGGRPAGLNELASLGHDLLIHAVDALLVGLAASLGRVGGVHSGLGHVAGFLIGGAAAEHGGAQQGSGGQGSDLDFLGHCGFSV
jgi:hypothetical protein